MAENMCEKKLVITEQDIVKVDPVRKRLYIKLPREQVEKLGLKPGVKIKVIMPENIARQLFAG